MCVAVPGEIIEIEGSYAKADVLGNICKVYSALVSPRIGDHVLIHAGCAIEILKPEESGELERLHREIRDLAR